MAKKSDREGVQEVIVGAEGEEVVDAFDESPLKDRPLATQKRYHH